MSSPAKTIPTPIYVDGLLPWPKSVRWRYGVVTHLFTMPENLEALHELAARIGLKRCWFQAKRRTRSMSHYDLSPAKRAAAIAAGAQICTPEIFLAHMRAWRQHWESSLDVRREHTDFPIP